MHGLFCLTKILFLAPNNMPRRSVDPKHHLLVRGVLRFGPSLAGLFGFLNVFHFEAFQAFPHFLLFMSRTLYWAS